MRSATLEEDISRATPLEPRRRPHVRRAPVMTAGILAVGLTVAACGSSPSAPRAATGSTSAHSTAGGSTGASGLVAYSSCMRSHGVPNFPDPTSSGGIPKPAVESALGAVSNAQATAAQNDCAHVLAPGESLGGQIVKTVTAKDQQYYLNAVACMRSHGFSNFPDPVFSGGSVNLSIPPSIDQNSTQFIHAAQICTKLIPAGLPKG
jgi:hypothetical protein